jgi:hypothetical protein
VTEGSATRNAVQDPSDALRLPPPLLDHKSSTFGLGSLLRWEDKNHVPRYRVEIQIYC